MQALFNVLVRLLLVAAGLVVAASIAVAVALGLTLWAVRYGWARLTGRPITPFVVHINLRRGFESMARRAEPVRPAAREIGDVTDVEAKPPRE
jgi:hypothetical protein